MRTVITRKTLGISWDDQQVQACVIRSGIAEFTVERIIRIPRELDDAGSPRHTLAEDLRVLSDRVGSEFEICVAALPENELMYRTLTRPFADRRKIAETIGLEAETLLPSLDSKLITDFVLLGEDPSGATLIQVLCTKASSVQALIGAFRATGLDPEIVDCPSVAASGGARATLDLPADTTVVLLRMGWKETSVTILFGGEIAYVGALPFGFWRLVTALAAEQGQTSRTILEKARASGIEAGEDLSGFFREILIMLEKSGKTSGEQVLVPT
ncbi:MAG: pilus assembly protein PilM, partial [Deltaproteobacteria bacterium]|nr:pilus assembly protein PilM [Deltaproteobacteria bacterium]